MEHPFPSTQQIKKQFCFLSPYEQQQAVIQELDSHVLIAQMQGSPLMPSQQLTIYLRHRYGGHLSQWQLTVVRGGHLLRVPHWLHNDDLIMDSPFWEEAWGLQFLPWQCLDGSAPLPPMERVLITVWDFPIDFWHLHYFWQATTGMGRLIGFSGRSVDGQDKSGISMFVECANLSLIPFFLYIGHQDRWTRCRVELHGRPHLDDLGHPPLPPSSGGDDIQLRGFLNPQLAIRLNLLEWRRMALICSLVARDPNRMATHR